MASYYNSVFIVVQIIIMIYFVVDSSAANPSCDCRCSCSPKIVITTDGNDGNVNNCPTCGGEGRPSADTATTHVSTPSNATVTGGGDIAVTTTESANVTDTNGAGDLSFKCPEGFIHIHLGCYQFINKEDTGGGFGVSHDKAQLSCGVGSHLVSLNTKKELIELSTYTANLNDSKRYWSSGVWSNKEDFWVWKPSNTFIFDLAYEPNIEDSLPESPAEGQYCVVVAWRPDLDMVILSYDSCYCDHNGYICEMPAIASQSRTS